MSNKIMSENVSMKLYDLREYKHNTTVLQALGEGVVNGVDAAMEGDNPIVSIRFPKGNRYSWTKAKKHYIQILNSGAAFSSMREGLSVYMSSHSSANHVFGMGLKYFLAYFGVREEVTDGSGGINFIIETKLEDRILYMEGPYSDVMVQKNKPLFDWEYGDEFTTSVMVEVPDSTWESLRIEESEELYNFLCWKFGMKLYKCPTLRITWGNKNRNVRSIIPGRMPNEVSPMEMDKSEFEKTVVARTISFDDDRVSKMFSYEYIHWNKCDKAYANRRYQGVTVFCDWIAIAHLGTKDVIAKRTMLKKSLENAWDSDSFGYKEHDSRNGLISYINVTPAENVLVPFTADKSRIDMSTLVGQTLRREIDAVCVGDFYRNFTCKHDEKVCEELQYKNINTVLRLAGIDDVVPIRQVRISNQKNSKVIDIAGIKIHDGNRAKYEAFVSGEIKHYYLSPEDFDHPEAKLFIVEMKKSTMPLKISTIEQAFRYGFSVSNKYGIDDRTEIRYAFAFDGRYDDDDVKPWLQRKCKSRKEGGDGYEHVLELPALSLYQEM